MSKKHDVDEDEDVEDVEDDDDDKGEGGGDGDGGFEVNILQQPHLKEQWWPQLKTLLGQHPQMAQMTETDAEQYINSLKFYTGLSFVVKYRGGNTVPAETDLILADPETNQIFAHGEVKHNPNDVCSADKQLRRDRLMLHGQVTTDHLTSETYPDFTSDGVTERYLSKVVRTNRPDFLPSHYDNHVITFIITGVLNDDSGVIAIPSKIATQTTHWLFSSSVTPEDYIQEKIDELETALHLRDLTEVGETVKVFSLVE